MEEKESSRESPEKRSSVVVEDIRADEPLSHLPSQIQLYRTMRRPGSTTILSFRSRESFPSSIFNHPSMATTQSPLHLRNTHLLSRISSRSSSRLFSLFLFFAISSSRRSRWISSSTYNGRRKEEAGEIEKVGWKNGDGCCYWGWIWGWGWIG